MCVLGHRTKFFHMSTHSVVIMVNQPFKGFFVVQISVWTCWRTGLCITVSHCHLFCLTPPLPSLSLHPPGRPLPPTSSSSLLPPSLPSSSSAPHHPSPGPSPPIRECQVPLLEKNSTHSHLEPHPDDSYMLRAQPSSTGKRELSMHPPFYPFILFMYTSVCHPSSCVHFLIWFGRCSVKTAANLCFNLLSHLVWAFLFLLLCIPSKSAFVCRAWNQIRGTYVIVVRIVRDHKL